MYSIGRKIGILIIVSSSIFIFGCNKKATADMEGKTEELKAGSMSEVAIIKTRHGDIVVKFFPELAPKHVSSFIKLSFLDL